MMIVITREELRADIREITTEVVTKVVKEAKYDIVRMVNEDLAAMDQKMDRIDRKLNRTNRLLLVHIADPSAHSKA